MKLTLIEFGGSQRQVECESFEFRSNHITNWIRIKYQDGNKEMIYDVVTIKAESEEEK